MYYTGIAGEEMLPKTDALQKMPSAIIRLNMWLCAGWNLKRLQNPEAIQNLRIVKEKDGIMILEKY